MQYECNYSIIRFQYVQRVMETLFLTKFANTYNMHEQNYQLKTCIVQTESEQSVSQLFHKWLMELIIN